MTGAKEEPPDLARIQVREEVRQELLEESQDREKLAQMYDARVRALVVSFALLAAVLVPLVGLVLGAAVRVFRLASGL